jgi:hypothetical protein
MEIFRDLAGDFGANYRILKLLTEDERDNIVLVPDPVVYACGFIFISLVECSLQYVSSSAIIDFVDFLANVLVEVSASPGRIVDLILDVVVFDYVGTAFLSIQYAVFLKRVWIISDLVFKYPLKGCVEQGSSSISV